MEEIVVIKRDGSKEPYTVDKIHKVVFWATEGLAGVSPSDVEINAQLQIHSGIKSADIHKVLINAANNLISEEHPNYQYVAARLALFSLRKEVYNQFTPIPLYDHILKCIDQGAYDKKILDWYTKEEIEHFESHVKHTRDFNFTYAGLQQMLDKYLIKNRKTGQVFESPQYAYMLIAMTFFRKYEGQRRIDYVLKYYNAISKFKINLPTPVLCGVRSPKRQYSSCTLVDIDDTLESIFQSAAAIGYYTANRAGIGMNIGRLRPVGAQIRDGEVVSTGLIPFLKLMEAATKSTSQNGVRGGGGTVSIPCWHTEIEDIIVLKNNRGSEDNRVRKLDYCVQMSKLFLMRAAKNEQMTLFDPHEVPELYDAFGTPEFDEMYERYERRYSLNTRKIDALDLLKKILIERIETGRIYLMFMDHAVQNGPLLDKVWMTNLCVEILINTFPIQHIDDENGEIGTCILAAYNIGAIKDIEEYDELSDLIVRSLDYVIEEQDYPVISAELSAKFRRNIGVGITNLAYWLAKRGLKYSDPRAVPAVDELMEKIQYSLLKASNQLAQEEGACEGFSRTKYSLGMMPQDRWIDSQKELVTRDLFCDWEDLREKIAQHGLRHSVLTAIMPCESSSVVQNSTNGIEPVRQLLTVKKSKQGNLKMLVPEFYRLRNQYELAYDMPSNRGYLTIAAVIQRWIDQAMSTNMYYSYGHYEDGILPLEEVTSDTLYAYTVGIKNLYYLNTDDGNYQLDMEEDKGSGCDSGACSI